MSRYARSEELVDRRYWQRSRVTMIGMGSMGNPVVEFCVRMGMCEHGRLRLFDGDKVEDRNLESTFYRQRDCGDAKVEASYSRIIDINNNYHGRVFTYNEMVNKQTYSNVMNCAHTSDLLCLFADDHEMMDQLSRDCNDVCPQVRAVFGERCDFAEVAFSIPGRTLSVFEIMGRRRRQRIEKPQALGVDTFLVSCFVAKICLSLLLPWGAKGSEYMVQCFANAPLFEIGLRRKWIFSNMPQDQAMTIYCVGTSNQSLPR